MRSRFVPTVALIVASMMLAAACASSSETTTADGTRSLPSFVENRASADQGDETSVVTRGDRSDSSRASDSSVGEGCSSTDEDSTTDILTSLVDDLRSIGQTAAAEELTDLAADVDGGEPTAETLAETMRVLSEVRVESSREADVGCLGLVSNATERLDGADVAMTSSESASQSVAASAPQSMAVSDEAFASTIERGFGIAEEDASCVVSELGDLDASALDDIDVLVALSACANQP